MLISQHMGPVLSPPVWFHMQKRPCNILPITGWTAPLGVLFRCRCHWHYAGCMESRPYFLISGLACRRRPVADAHHDAILNRGKDNFRSPPHPVVRVT